MKLTLRMLSLFMFLAIFPRISEAQEIIFNAQYKNQVVKKLVELMNDFYVFPEVALSTEQHLLNQMASGHFDQFENNKSFADALTQSVQSINKDKHMRIMVNRPYTAPRNSQERKIEMRLDQLEKIRSFNAGFSSVKIMEGNVGYLDLRAFARLETGILTADAYMKLVSNTDAIIIDLSKNGGGSPEMVQYLCSYFFNRKLLLNSLYFRERNETREYWTLDEVGGDKMPNIPLFVITSSSTFSGAEEFSYNMQTQKRATLVGQTTRGGANPGNTMRINDNLSVFIPTGKAINPITQTNWEGIGVVPDVSSIVGESLDKAHELAVKAAISYRQSQKEEYTKLFLSLENQLKKPYEKGDEKEILKFLSECINKKLLREGDVNMLGYEYLMEHKKLNIAQSIFKANTILFPNSANAFDSYAESLMMKGELDISLTNYKKAVEIAMQNKDRDLELFRNNLKKLELKINNKK